MYLNFHKIMFLNYAKEMQTHSYSVTLAKNTDHILFLFQPN